ncbi:MAG: type VI secretion system tube protein Hcp [Candidatus Acidiferrales bacterium]
MNVELSRQIGSRSGTSNRLSGSIRAVFRTTASVLAVAAWLSAGGAARAQDAGYMRVLTSTGHQMAGESTDPAHYGWIPFRQATVPSASEIVAIAHESTAGFATSASRSVHRPIVIIKDRDESSLGLLGALTSHQHFPEVDIVLTKNDQTLTRFKLTDATIISIRGGGTNSDTDAPMEQLRLNYAKIEIQH